MNTTNTETAYLKFGGAFTGNPNGPFQTVSVPMRRKYLRWQELGLSQTASGYGRKLTSSMQVFWENRWRRVYVCQFSNAGTAYIVRNGKPFATVD
jgi:hypothetical protein